MNELGIVSERPFDGYTLVSIDTQKAKYQGRPWGDLNEYGKRKFENLLFITKADKRIKVVYGNF